MHQMGIFQSGFLQYLILLILRYANSRSFIPAVLYGDTERGMVRGEIMYVGNGRIDFPGFDIPVAGHTAGGVLPQQSLRTFVIDVAIRTADVFEQFCMQDVVRQMLLHFFMAFGARTICDGDKCVLMA